MNPKRGTKTIFKYREGFITETLKTIINVTCSSVFFTMEKEHSFQTESRFVQEEIRRGSVLTNFPFQTPTT